MTHRTRPARPWLPALILLEIAAAILIALVAVVLLRPGPSPVSAVGTNPSPTPNAVVAATPASTPAQAATTPEPTASPSTTPKPKASARPTATAQPMASAGTATTPGCRPGDLSARITAWDGAAGSRIAEIELRNDATIACTVGEPTALRLVAADGTVLIDSAKTGGTPSPSPDGAAVTIAAGAAVRTDVRVANYCGPEPKAPIGVSLTLPQPSGTILARPASGVSSAEAVPPCNGPIGADIEMNGWQS
jgi:hypothetical protein